jgi:SOS-response transcriptional repressor LexA
MKLSKPNERLRYARENAGYLTPKAFSSAHDIPQPTYHLHESGRRAILPAVASKYAEALNCSASWILTGEGDPPEPPEPIAPPPPFRIAELDVRASAGAGGNALRIDNLSTETEIWQVPQDFMRAQTTASPDNIRIIRIYGDSMAPLFQPGDRVLVDLSDVKPSPAGVFVLWDGLGIVVKRVEFVPYSAPPTVKLMSANADYATYERPLADIHINGRVIAKWQWT